MTVTTAHMSKLALPFRSSRDVGGGVYASQRMTQDNFHEWGDERCLSQALSQVRINTGSPAVHEDAYENINPTPPPSLFDNPCPPKGEIRFTAGGGILRVEQTPAQRSCDLLQPPTTGSLHQQPIMESREDVAEDVQHRWPYEGYGSQAEVLCTPDFITPVDQQFSAEGNSLQGAPHRLRSPVRLTPVRVKRPRQATFAMSLSSSQVSSQGGAGGGGDSACSSDMSLGGGGGPASQRSHESAPACRPPLRSLDPNATPGFPYGRGPIKGAVPPTPARRSSACGGAQGSLSHRLQMAGPQPGAVEPPAVRPGGYRIEELMGSQGESSSQSQSVSIGDVIRSAIPRGGGASRGGEAEEEDPVGPVGATAAAGAAIAGRGTSEAGAACSGEARRLGSVGTAHAHAPPQPRMPPNSKSRVLAARGRAPRSPPCQPNPFLVVTRGATAGSSDAVMADGGGAEAAGGVGSGTGNGSSGQAAGGNDAAVGALPRPGSGSYRPLNLVSSLSGAPMSRYREMFKEVKEMGRGSFGKVMEVRHRLDGCLYAVKYSIHPLLDDSVRRRAMLEVQALAAIGESSCHEPFPRLQSPFQLCPQTSLPCPSNAPCSERKAPFYVLATFPWWLPRLG
eukprot:jgi/Mesvir1/12771/Mv22829-RA.2